MNLQLKDLLRGIPIARISGSLERPVGGLSCRVNEVRPGSVHVVLPGEGPDGGAASRYFDALARGATALVCESNPWPSRSATKVEVPDPRGALAAMAATVHGVPSGGLCVIGLTGGGRLRPALTAAVQRFLEGGGLPTGLIGSVEHGWVGRRLPAGLQPLEALDVHRMMADMRRAGCGAVVVELEEGALARGAFRGLEWDLLVDARLPDERRAGDGFPSDAALKPMGRRVALAGGWRRGAAPAFHVEVGHGSEAWSISAEPVRSHAGGTRARFRGPGWDFMGALPLPGRSAFELALTAMAVGERLGMPILQLSHALRRMQPVGAFREPLGTDPERGFTVVLDRSGPASRYAEVVGEIRATTPGRVLVVVRNEDPAPPATARIAGADEVWWTAGETAYRGALADAARSAREGDVLLILGPGPVPFGGSDDRFPVEELLEQGRTIPMS